MPYILKDFKNWLQQRKDEYYLLDFLEGRENEEILTSLDDVIDKRKGTYCVSICGSEYSKMEEIFERWKEEVKSRERERESKIIKLWNFMTD